MAQFLNYYPQYHLQHLRDGSLAPQDFIYLVAGMLDNMAPEATEPKADMIARRIREMAAASTKGKK